MSKEFVEVYKALGHKFDKYKEFIIFEMECHENIKTGLEFVIR